MYVFAHLTLMARNVKRSVTFSMVAEFQKYIITDAHDHRVKIFYACGQPHTSKLDLHKETSLSRYNVVGRHVGVWTVGNSLGSLGIRRKKNHGAYIDKGWFLCDDASHLSADHHMARQGGKGGGLLYPPLHITPLCWDTHVGT